MVRSLSLVLSIAGLSLAGHSPANEPTQEGKQKPKGAEVLLYIKPVPGKTDKEQDEIRQKVRYTWLVRGLDNWILRPTTEIPGLKGPFSAPERRNWSRHNVQFTWVEETGALRIFCVAGSPREQALFINSAVKQSIASYEQEKKRINWRIITIEKEAANWSTLNTPQAQEQLKECQEKVKKHKDQLTLLPEIILLELAEVPSK